MAGKGGLAEQIRTGLDSGSSSDSGYVVRKAVRDELDELHYRKPLRRHVNEFACVMGIALLLFAGIAIRKGAALSTPASLIVTTLIVLLVGYRAPKVLLPVWRSWMALATGIGVVVSTLVISIAWIVMMVPLALFLKAIGKHVVDMTYRAPVTSYWEARDPKLDDFKLLERQY